MPNTTQTDEGPTKKFSPFAGCSIFIIAGVLVLGMLGFTAWSYFKVKETVESFTIEQPKPITLVDTEGKEPQQTTLKEKLIGFRHNIEAKHKAQITLSADEMNLAIATFDILKPHRNNLHITAIEDGTIEAEVCYPIKASMGSDTMRYLTGSVTITPELVEGAAFPRITSIQTHNDGNIPEEFKKFISETLLHPLVNDKELGPIFKSLSAVEIKNSHLILETDPNYQAPDAPEQESADSFMQKFMIGFGIIAVIFLAFVSFVIILSRRKAKNQ